MGAADSEGRQGRTLCDFIAGLAAGGAATAVFALHERQTETLSYAALSARVDALANGLAARGVGRGSHVALCAAHGPEWLIAALATIAAGAVLVPVDPQSDPASLSHIVEDCGAALWFTSSRTEARLRERVGDAVTSFRLDGPPDAESSWQNLFRPGTPVAPPVAPEDIAVMFYTSGTTGLPKGVPLSHRNLMFQIEALLPFGLVGGSERVLLALPLHHVYPFSIGLLGVMALRGAIVLPRAVTGPEILRAMREGAVTTIIGVPRLYEVFLSGMIARARSRGRIAAGALSGLLWLNVRLRRWAGVRIGRRLFAGLMRAFGAPVRMLVSGGAPLDAMLAARLDALGWRVACGYGLTETSPLLTILPPGDRAFATVGRPVPGIEMRIAPQEGVGEAGRAIGEVQVRGPGVFAGYHNLPEKTAAAFTGDGWFRTEDLGSLDARGYLHLRGRQTTLIVTRAGENVQPETLETGYARDPAIREIGVLQRDGELCAVVVPDYKTIRERGETDADASIRQAMAAAAKRLPSHHRVARYLISRDALLRTRLGKIRRAELVRRFAEIESGAATRAARRPGPMPLTEMSDDDRALLDEPVARAAWDLLCERYPDRPIGPDASLAMDLGIDSLEWINVTLDIRQRAGVDITEEATARIETVRDLLNEAIAAESSAMQETIGLVFDDPQHYVSDDQRRWLRPLRSSEVVWARALYALNRFVMRRFFRLAVVGSENLPREGKFVLAPNHMSVLDPFVVAAAVDFEVLRRTYWAGWTGIAFANRLFRFVSRIAQVLPIEQERAAFSSLAMSLIVLGDGKNLIWFPEGGRSRDGRLQRFRTGIGLLLERRPTTVVPMLIEGTFDAMPTGRRFPRFRPLCATFGPARTRADLEQSGRGSARAERIANALQAAVAALQRSGSGARGEVGDGAVERE